MTTTISERRKILRASIAMKARKRKHGYKQAPIRVLRRLHYSLQVSLRKQGLSEIPKDAVVYWKEIVDHLGPCPGGIRSSRAWKIAHIVPLSSFDLTRADEVSAAMMPVNHRWMRKRDLVDGWDRVPTRQELIELLYDAQYQRRRRAGGRATSKKIGRPKVGGSMLKPTLPGSS